MTWMDFAIRLLVGFFLGVGIGIERQWLRSRAILKTNVLVTLGAAMFVMLSIMTPGDTSPTRISAQIVSGIGFLGGGVILREGASVRGINTAATLWCAAAIGTLVGSGYLIQAYLGTFAVVGANLLLRPLVEAFKHQGVELDYQTTTTTTTRSWNHKSQDEILSSTADDDDYIADDDDYIADDDNGYIAPKLSNSDSINSSKLPLTDSYSSKMQYSCHLTCEPEEEAQVLTILFQSAKEWGWKLNHLDSKNIVEEQQSCSKEMVQINAVFMAYDNEYKAKNIEEVMSSLKSDSIVNSISWQFSC